MTAKVAGLTSKCIMKINAKYFYTKSFFNISSFALLNNIEILIQANKEIDPEGNTDKIKYAYMNMIQSQNQQLSSLPCRDLGH